MLKPIENQYSRIGQINRSHGINGEVLIISSVFAPSLFEEVDLVNLQNSRGDMIPARIESVRVEEKGNRLSFFVKFEHVTDRNQADRLKDYPVYVKREVVERVTEETENEKSYSGYKLYDEANQQIGRVARMIDNPAHPIIQVVTEDDRQLLIPFVDEYIHSLNEEEKIIICQNLDQLEEL